MVSDSQILNAFMGASTAQQPSANLRGNDSPILPTGSRPSYNQPQSYSDSSHQTQNLSSFSFDQITSLINSQNSRIDQIANALSQLLQQQQQQFSDPSPKQIYPQMYSSPTSSPGEIPIEDAEDVKNVWNLADRVGGNYSDDVKQKIVQRAISLGLVDSLPQTALDWANSKGLMSPNSSSLFNTEVALSDPDRKLVESALSFMDSLSSPNDVFCVYKLVKSNLSSRLSGSDLNQLMSDFSAHQIKLSQPPQIDPKDSQPQQQQLSETDIGQLLNEEEVESILDDELQKPLPLSFAEVDASVWSIAQAVAKRRFGDEVTDAQVSPIYEVLIGSPEKSVFSKFSDPVLLSNAIEESKSIYQATWPSLISSAYVVKSYRDQYYKSHSELTSAFEQGAEASSLVEELFSEFTSQTT